MTTKYKIGDRYGNLIIQKIFLGGIGKKGRIVSNAFCLCDCGNHKVIATQSLRNGNTRSCGCLKGKGGIKHGMCKTPIYNSWDGLLQRCTNPNNKRYCDYGGRGITVCKRWLKFENFFADMGDKPTGTSIDRIDNSKGYCKQNCKWSFRFEQQNNMRSNHWITYQGETKNVGQWAKKLNMSYSAFSTRIRRGWTIERVFNQAVQKRHFC